MPLLELEVIGYTAITFVMTDASGLSTTCPSRVRVADDEPPTLLGCTDLDGGVRRPTAAVGATASAGPGVLGQPQRLLDGVTDAAQWQFHPNGPATTCDYPLYVTVDLGAVRSVTMVARGLGRVVALHHPLHTRFANIRGAAFFLKRRCGRARR